MTQPTRVFIDGIPPQKQHPSDACYDLRAADAVVIEPYAAALVDCGFTIAIPEGMVGLVCPRSGMALKNWVTVLNAPGVIDPGYMGNVGVILMNLGPRNYHVQQGDRIAQLLIVPCLNATLIQNKNAFTQSERGGNGFGSTGVA